jgi:TAG lipase/lysophosphatidylethanolamine acyltransferase
MRTISRRRNPVSRIYDFRLITERLEYLLEYRADDDILSLISLLRSGLVRNLGNMTAPKLFTRAFSGTKVLIDNYITQVALTIEYISSLPTDLDLENVFTSQAKLELLHDARQAFGRSTLLLQGGSIFGMCHLGVVKALHLRGLLPRVITGTATGALIAALVGIHSEDELLDFLNGDGIDLTAFDRRHRGRNANTGSRLISDYGSGWFQTFIRRVRRYFREGYFLDVNVLEECVRANVGDLTFEEAYDKSKRVLNITVATSGKGGVPNLLNYLTAPNVLIASAAVASNTSSTRLYSPVQLYCKDETGAIVPWELSQEITVKSWRETRYRERESPLARLAELFNVNHFIISQARPYIAPFLRTELQRPDPRFTGWWSIPAPLIRFTTLEIHHRLKQLDRLGLLPISIRRMLVDENIPGASVTLVPELLPKDWLKLFENPTKESLDYWILRGERSVWPAVAALKVRCAIEVELDKGYQIVRRRRPGAGQATLLQTSDSDSTLLGGSPQSLNGDMSARPRAASMSSV